MPELPEVEVSRLGIAPHLEQQKIDALKIRIKRLRWPIPADLNKLVAGQTITAVTRRGKYLLLQTTAGSMILHLGMSGSLRFVPTGTPAGKHDHVDIIVQDKCLRFNDPRRFGALLFSTNPLQHNLLKNLGPEPLEQNFNADYLYQRSRKRSVAVKTFIMNSQIVVGVGNIYAAEILFLAGIHPERSAGRISKQRYQKLVIAIKKVLKNAIKAGGTTLQDFHNADGKPGYFKQKLLVYGKDGQDCQQCGTSLRLIKLSGRSTVYCRTCQK